MNIKKLVMVILAVLATQLAGCITLHRNGDVSLGPTVTTQVRQTGQSYGIVTPCPAGTFDTGQRNQYGGHVCAAQQNPNQGCVPQPYGSHCGGPNYRYQSPMIPPQMRRMSDDQAPGEPDAQQRVAETETSAENPSAAPLDK